MYYGHDSFRNGVKAIDSEKYDSKNWQPGGERHEVYKELSRDFEELYLIVRK